MNGKKNILNYNEIRKAGPLDRLTAYAKLFFAGKKQSRKISSLFTDPRRMQRTSYMAA